MTLKGPMSEDPQFITVYAPDDYPYTTDSAVRFVPVTLGGKRVGYLWAAITDDALGFHASPDAGDVGFNTSVAWVERMRWAKANGVSPLQALRQWAGQPEDPKCGYLPEGQEREVPSLDALREIAGS